MMHPDSLSSGQARLQQLRSQAEHQRLVALLPAKGALTLVRIQVLWGLLSFEFRLPAGRVARAVVPPPGSPLRQST